MTDHLKVVPLGVQNLADIPGMLEYTAQRIREGDYGSVSRAVLVITCGDPGNRTVEVFDFGPDEGGTSTVLGALGMLAAGQFRMLNYCKES